MKKKKQLFVDFMIVLIAVIYIAILILGNVYVAKCNVAVQSGSYAETYAEKHNLNIVEIADSQEDYFDLRYETFSYNEMGSSITLEEYLGSSTNLVVPEAIGGKNVTALSEDFIKSLNNVEKLYIPDKVNTIEGTPVETLEINCSMDNLFYEENKDSDWNFNFINDSDLINFNLGDIPFGYNKIDDKIEITSYGGDEDIVVIPSYINGLPVTAISMDLIGIADIVVIPDTITSITGKSQWFLYTNVFLIGLIFSILAFVISLLTVNILLPRYSAEKPEEYLLTGNQVAITIAYLMVQVGFSIYCIYFSTISAYIELVVSLVILVMFVLGIYLTSQGRIHVKKVESESAEKILLMKDIKKSVQSLPVSVGDGETQRMLQRLKDEIRYSPLDSNGTQVIEADIQKEIEHLVEAINESENEEIKNIVANLINLVQKRNLSSKK